MSTNVVTTSEIYGFRARGPVYTLPADTGTTISPVLPIGTREMGVIEKKCFSYGFIDCAERDYRIFFHYSSFQGNINELEIGDGVDFEIGLDEYTSKPVAANIIKIPRTLISFEWVSPQRLVGTITTVPQPSNIFPHYFSQGQICFMNSGECFFLPYTIADVIRDCNAIKSEDPITFFIATNKKNGAVRAVCIETIDPDEAEALLMCSQEILDYKSDRGIFNVLSGKGVETYSSVSQTPATTPGKGLDAFSGMMQTSAALSAHGLESYSSMIQTTTPPLSTAYTTMKRAPGKGLEAYSTMYQAFTPISGKGIDTYCSVPQTATQLCKQKTFVMSIKDSDRPQMKLHPSFGNITKPLAAATIMASATAPTMSTDVNQCNATCNALIVPSNIGFGYLIPHGPIAHHNHHPCAPPLKSCSQEHIYHSAPNNSYQAWSPDAY